MATSVSTDVVLVGLSLSADPSIPSLGHKYSAGPAFALLGRQTVHLKFPWIGALKNLLWIGTLSKVPLDYNAQQTSLGLGHLEKFP